MVNDESTPPGRKRATVLLALGGYANTVITIVQGLLLVPMYLHFLGANTYGLWLASGGMLGMLLLMNFGVGSLVTQRVAHAYGQKDLSGVGAYFVNGMFVYFSICLLYGAIGWILSFWIAGILKVSGTEAELLKQCFRIAVVAMTIGIFNECLRSFSQAMLRPVIPMLGLAAGRVLGIVGTIWMLFDDLGLWAIPVGMLIAEGLILIINITYVLSLFQVIVTSAKLEKRIITEYIKTSPALLLAKSINSVSQQSEPLLITMAINAEATTAYMIARKAADMLFLIISVVNGSILSSFSHLTGEGNPEKISDVVNKLLFIVFIFSVGGFSVYIAMNISFISLWVGENYVLSHEITLLIGLGFFSRALRGMLWQLLYAIGDFTYTSVVVLLEGIGKVTISVVLLGFMGVSAIPIALVLSSYMSLVVLGLRLVKSLSIQIKLDSITRCLLLFIVGILIAQFSAISNTWIIFILSSFLLGCSFLIAACLINWKMCRSYLKRGGLWPL